MKSVFYYIEICSIQKCVQLLGVLDMHCFFRIKK